MYHHIELGSIEQPYCAQLRRMVAGAIAIMTSVKFHVPICLPEGLSCLGKIRTIFMLQHFLPYI